MSWRGGLRLWSRGPRACACMGGACVTKIASGARRGFERAQQHARLSAVAHAEPLEDRGQVRLHRGLLHAEAIGDLLVEKAFADEAEHAHLLRAERGEPRGECAVAG